ncbi:FecR family protein [Rhodoplanes sp. Z2-YC6860]|uniref:FecR family protein n=1 Tax=Rhodoplanes sp. Z2-YC6860 TaxID=674703 RepID=UPI00078BB0B5|nr:FecR domain-containing protein [Rhodoplanes sp. Z2-YC6860]AMN41443.1 VBCS repeat-containing protein [Rhodoplanes sp. Z2-YC6860]
MQRREFITLLGCAAGWQLSWPFQARAQTLASPTQATDNQVGQVATLQGSATVTRNNAAAVALKVSDPVYRRDVLQAGANSLLSVTFDDETTLNLNANARLTVDNFVYQEGGGSNAALFNVIRGTVAFVAGQAAKTGDMKFTTATASLGIRGTTGVIEVPDGAAGGTTEPRIKLYPDADGRVGRIEVFDRQGGRLGTLTQGASAFALRPGLGGRIAAVPFQIPPQEAARDRSVVQRLFASHNVGRQMAIQRRQQRRQNQPRQNNQRPNQQRPGGPQQQNRNPRQQPFQQQPRQPRERPPRGNRRGPNRP